jgi:DNA mismatch repair protein MutL
VLNISLPPREVDVNVHPAKKEVKFLQDQAVFSAVYKAVQGALATQSPVQEMTPHPPATQPTPAASMFGPIQPTRAEASQALQMFQPA